MPASEDILFTRVQPASTNKLLEKRRGFKGGERKGKEEVLWEGKSIQGKKMFKKASVTVDKTRMTERQNVGPFVINKLISFTCTLSSHYSVCLRVDRRSSTRVLHNNEFFFLRACNSYYQPVSMLHSFSDLHRYKSRGTLRPSLHGAPSYPLMGMVLRRAHCNCPLKVPNPFRCAQTLDNHH